MNVRILSAAFLIAATAAPSRAQDEGETRRRFVPGVYSNRRVERDEDDTQQAPKQDFGTLLGNFADSVNHTVFPKNDVVGDVELFRKKSDNELVRYGSDFPRWTLLTEAVIPAEDKYNQAYQKLVEKALIPLAGEAGPMVKELFERLKPIGKEAGDDSKEINDFSQESEQLTSQFPQFPPTPPSGNPLQLDKMQPIQEKSQTRKAQFEDLKDMVKQINRIVLQAKNGLDGAKMLGDMARQDVKKAGDLDNLALGKAAQNRAGGSSSSSSGNGRSEPVLQGALERLQAAVKKGEKAQEAMDKFSDEDPEKGPLMKAVKAVEDSNEKDLKGSQTARESGGKINQALQTLKQIDPNAPDAEQQAQQPKQTGKDEQDKIKEAGRAAKDAADKGKDAIAQADKAWREIEENLLGKFQGGKSEIQTKFPVPFPKPYLRADPPKEIPTRQASSQRIKSKPIKYPDALGMSTDQVRRAEGLQERGGTSNCGPGGC